MGKIFSLTNLYSFELKDYKFHIFVKYYDVYIYEKHCMADILNTLFTPLPTGIMSSFMIVILFYWIVSFLGISFDDFDLGVDSDVDLDADSGVHSHGIFSNFLGFINAGKVPFMFILTCLIFFTWVGSLIVTNLISITWGWTSVFILLPLFILSIFPTKIVTIPIAKFLEKTGYQGESEINFFGSAGKMLSSISEDKVGVAEFMIDKDPIKLNVRSLSGEELKYGDIVIITNQPDEKKIYPIVKK